MVLYMRKRAFTLIELLVVIAIIAILAAILFPVFAQAKESAKQARTLSQMRQLAASVQIYLGDHDDTLVPASMRGLDGGTPTIWTEALQPYVKNKEIMNLPDSGGGYASNWNERRHQPIGYSDATGYDASSTAQPGSAPPGTEGFPSAANASAMEETSKVGLFTITPNARVGDTSTKHRGYVFNPYNGMDSPDGDYFKGLPLISDRDLVTQYGDKNYPNSPDLSAGQLKPVFARYGKTGKGEGRTPVIFADCHAKVYSANALNNFGTVIWRFR